MRSAVFNWAVSRMLLGEEKKETGKGEDKADGGTDGITGGWFGGRMALAFGTFANLALLFYFKYTNFFIENPNAFLGKDITYTRLLLPAGISFFIFQQIRWLVDSFNRGTRDYSFWEYFLSIVYFPKIAMGPISLHGEFIPQLKDPFRLKVDSRNMAQGLMIPAVGLFKEVIFTEFFVGLVNWGCAQAEIFSSTDAFLVMLVYTFQLYFDFSGYCDMAMGISRMLNLELSLNFDSPYKAMSPVKFWRRWHITPTRFLRKHTYFPPGGSRKGNLRTYMNITAAFLVSDFWHGAAWTLILRGALHSVVQALNCVFKRQWENLHTAFRWIITSLFVNLI